MKTKETKKTKIRFFRVLKKNYCNRFTVGLPFYVFINSELYYRNSGEELEFSISGSTLSNMEDDVRNGYAIEIELSEAVFSMEKELAEVLDFF